MDKPLFLIGFFVTVLGIMLLWVIIPSQHIPPMMSTVSPAFYPNIGSAILLAGGIGMLATSFRGRPKGFDLPELSRNLRFGSLMAVLFGSTLVLFHLVHFIAGGIMLVFSTMVLLGERRPHYLVAVSFLAPVVIWVFIDVLLGRSLP